MLSPVAELECADDARVRAGAALAGAVAAHRCAALALPVDLRRDGSLLLAHRGDVGAARRVLGLLARQGAGRHAPQA